MKRLLRMLGKACLWLLLLLLMLLALVLFLGGTDTGSRLLANQAAKRVPGLELGRFGGNLAEGINTDSLNYTSDAFTVDARGVDTAWRLGCLVRRKACIDRVKVDELRFTQTAPPAGNKSEPRDGPLVLPEIRLPLAIDARDVEIGRFVHQPYGDAPPQVLENVRLSATAEGSTVDVTELSLDYRNHSASASGSIDMSGDYPLDLELKASARNLIDEHDVTLDATLERSLADLAISADIGGAIDAHIEGSARPLEADVPANLRLNADELGWPLDAKTLVRADNTTLALDGTLDDYRLELDTTVTGKQVPKTIVDLGGFVNTERAALDAVRLDTLGGEITGAVNAGWVDGIRWDTDLALADITPSVQFEGVNGQLGGDVVASGKVDKAGNWSLALDTLDIDGTLQGYPFILEGNIEKTLDDIWTINTLKLDNGQNRVNATGTISDTWALSADVKLPELGSFVPDLAGGVNAELTMSGALAEPSASIDASADTLRYRDYSLNGLDIKGDIDALFNENSNLAVRVGTIDAAGQNIRNLRLDLTGSRADHALEFFADGPHATAVDLSITGSLDETPDRKLDWKGELVRAELEVPAHEITLTSPVPIEWDQAKQLLQVGAHCWGSLDASLCLETPINTAKEGKARITLDQYKLERLDPFLPAKSALGGTLGLTTDIAWGSTLVGGLKAKLAADINNGRVAMRDANDELVDFRYRSLTLDTEANPENIDATLVLESKNLGTANIDVNLQPAEAKRPISGTVRLDGLDIGVAQALVPDFETLEGDVSIDGRIGGTLSAPRFNGKVMLDDPRVVSELLPLPITGGSVRADVNGSSAVLSGNIESTTDGRKGNIGVDGSANWSHAPWRASVTLNGENLDVRTDPVKSSTVNPRITLQARPDLLRITGNVDIPEAVIDVEELPEGASGVSGDIVIVEDEAEADRRRARREAAANRMAIVMAVDVTLGKKVTLSAYGLDASLTGDLDVRMRLPDPVQLGGKVEVVDGIYKKYGQDLKASGEVIFVGPVNQSRLDIRAVREIETEDRIAGLNIVGTVETPEITLFTEPADKSEDAILSYIVLGRDINEASDQETNLLQAAALALTVRGGRSIGQNVADALGVQDFSLETAGSGDNTELVVSGRLNDRLLLRYGSSVFSSQNTLYLRYDLTKKLYVETASGVEQALDIFYSFDF